MLATRLKDGCFRAMGKKGKTLEQWCVSTQQRRMHLVALGIRQRLLRVTARALSDLLDVERTFLCTCLCTVHLAGTVPPTSDIPG